MRMWYKKTVKAVYNLLWSLVNLSGCHQRKDRSFCIRGKQFPVCARCTGAFIGYLTSIFTYYYLKVPLWINAAFCLIMFADWFVQRIGVLESDNFRRFITGVLCGFGLMNIYICFLIKCYELVL